ncbi:hypothetical protein Ciccas_002541 [Cichlidogyrus casuarinus]|uniref:Cytosolic carboxypeptidase N-terminal domain-containing protein n=1 Tax=Cichlidogyrus casuarinus TaxID=1844966 RepID=A0ABD2QGY7_9PLAT
MPDGSALRKLEQRDCIRDWDNQAMFFKQPNTLRRESGVSLMVSSPECFPSCCFMDRFGVMRDSHGPFWPQGYGPLLKCPNHIFKQRQIDLEGEFLVEFLKTDFKFVTVNDMQMKVDDAQRIADYDKRRPQLVFDLEKTPPSTYNKVSNAWKTIEKSAKLVPPSLVFESRFECGNLKQAKRVGPFEYWLVLNPDLFTKRHTQWYYFQISNFVPRVTYKFTILNLVKPSSLYSQGLRPLLYSEMQAKKFDRGWYRVGHDIK